MSFELINPPIFCYFIHNMWVGIFTLHKPCTARIGGS
nr:MAG TPA: hypothetical protein [Bacteriophage sp.]